MKFKPIDPDCDKDGVDDGCIECQSAVECYEAQKINKEDIKLVNKKDALVVVLEKSGLDVERIQALTNGFGGYFRQANEVAILAKEIVVTDEGQVEAMQLARKLRFQIRDIRLDTDIERKEMKEKSLREGRAIDGAANIIKALIFPVEKYLEKQEKFAENKKAERDEEIFADRITQLQGYVEDTGLYYVKKVSDGMSDKMFEELLKTCRIAYEAKKEAERKVEANRLDEERKRAEEQEKIRKENEVLKEERKVALAEKDKQELVLKKERESREKILSAEKKRAAEEKAKQDEVIKKEKEEREKVETKLRMEKEAIETKLRMEKEAREQEIYKKEEEKRKELLAPDKQKLINFANLLDKIEVPNLSSREAGKIVDKSQEMINQVSLFLRENAKKL